MAVTASAVKSTADQITFLITQDGAAGTTLIITAAVTLAAASAGPLREMPGIGSDIAGLTTAIARARMLGDFGAAPTDAQKTDHCECFMTSRTVVADSVLVDADTDAANILRIEMNITAAAAAQLAYLRLKFCHTITR